jgi:hypothetical protein
MQYAKRLAVLLIFSLAGSGCPSMKLNDFKAGVTLPYSEKCFFVNAISGKETEYPADQCERMKKAGLIILSEDWLIIRKNFQINCQLLQCKQLVGKFDQLFLTLDKSLKLIPWK